MQKWKTELKHDSDEPKKSPKLFKSKQRQILRYFSAIAGSLTELLFVCCQHFEKMLRRMRVPKSILLFWEIKYFMYHLAYNCLTVPNVIKNYDYQKNVRLF